MSFLSLMDVLGEEISREREKIVNIQNCSFTLKVISFNGHIFCSNSFRKGKMKWIPKTCSLVNPLLVKYVCLWNYKRIDGINLLTRAEGKASLVLHFVTRTRAVKELCGSKKIEFR